MGVFPFICRELTDDDWQNRVKVFEIQLIVVCNPHVNIRVEYNDELHNNSNKKSISLTNLKETILYDYEKNVEISIFGFAKEWLKSSCEDRHISEMSRKSGMDTDAIIGKLGDLIEARR